MIKFYTMDGCGYCIAAKALLDFKKVDYQTVKVPDDITTRDFVETFPEIKQFPLITENDNVIGGLPQLQSYLLSKEVTTGLSL